MPKRELAAKNISSGPRSSTSLRAGLSWGLLAMWRDVARSRGFVIADDGGHGSVKRLRLKSGYSPREILRRERRQIVDAFADPDEMHRQSVLGRDGGQDPAPRRAVELGHGEPGDTGDLVKHLD